MRLGTLAVFGLPSAGLQCNVCRARDAKDQFTLLNGD